VSKDASPTADSGAKIVCRGFPRPLFALGAAIELLHSHQPFAAYPVIAFARTLRGQIARGHYLFAIRGGTLLGYVGWAICKEEIARAWVERRYVPTPAECSEGNTIFPQTYFSRENTATFALYGALRERYDGYNVYGLRQYRDGRERRTFYRAPLPPSGADGAG
jgi:hypothetical protein